MANAQQPITQPPGWMEEFLEKHGVATFILLVGGWWASRNVVEPMVRSADTFIQDIREVNVEMEKAYLESLAETRQRSDQVRDVLNECREQIKEIETKLEKHRMLFTQTEEN